MNAAPVRPGGDYVLYWMIAYRRTHWNFALDRAIEWAQQLKCPLLIFEALRCDYPWASDRLHRFVMDGMAERARLLEKARVAYFPYIEARPAAARGLLTALSEKACVVVTDEFPCFFLPRMVRAAAKKLCVRLEAVDSNGLLPLGAAPQAFSTAYAFRRFLQKHLPQHLTAFPGSNPIPKLRLPRLRVLPSHITRRWPVSSAENLEKEATISSLQIDHAVPPVSTKGGEGAAGKKLQQFLREKLAGYLDQRNQPEAAATSGLSPHLHFGHISSHQIFSDLMKREDWSLAKIALRSAGSRVGWWGVSQAAEAFLDQFVTWRELGFNFADYRSDYDQYDSLPDWAQTTLAKHQRDEREYAYTMQEFSQALTHDAVWNAAQRQLVREGRIHNYLRMLWGKKILEWTGTPREALEVMTHLNNRYALDGRDPNSYSGIFWCLGRYDRPWGPERPIFGTVRYMSSANTARKLRLGPYLHRYRG